MKVFPLPFRVTDEDGVEWSVRLTAFEGEVAVEQYRFEPGRRVMRDVARMEPSQALRMAVGLMRAAKTAAMDTVEEVHSR